MVKLQVKIKADKAEYRNLLQNKKLINHMVDIGKEVKDEAEKTASAAENGPGGTLDGYAAAGFDVIVEKGRNKRPKILVASYADEDLALRVLFYTQKRDGRAHLRAALRKVTK